jgi:two-component system phosphate regulon sensor histidine kinase PhoR
MERGELRFNLSQLNLNDLVTKAANNMELQVKAREGQINTDLDPKVSSIEGDQMHLYNVILNLVDNAIKYCRKRPEIAVSTSQSDNFITLSVRDNGIGMSRDEQRKIFETFYRVHSGNVHQTKGFGLGLSYVKAIIDKHQGQISVDSEPGQGTTIGISFPIVSK